jgi:UDP-N-acetylmuramate--alanine ligase
MMSDDPWMISRRRIARRRSYPASEGSMPRLRPHPDSTVPALPALDGVQSAYLIGIGGVGLGGAARLLAARGIRVRGSDRQAGAGVDRDDAPLPADVDLLVHSAAVPPEHPQVVEARARGLPTFKYAPLLGALMEDRFGVCVAGSHGKTTTSSLVASALVHAGRDPSFLVGGRLCEHGSGARSGGGPHFVAESCEFDRSFHAHRPRAAIVTNVDEDHLDYYRDLEEIQESFRVFAGLLPHDGTLVVNEAYVPVFRGDARLRAGLESYGFGRAATWRAAEQRVLSDGSGTAFTLHHEGRALGEVRVPMLGRHNALNACGAAALLAACGLDFEEVAAGLAAFAGVGRRLELVAERSGVTLYDDYGHHPAEIRVVIRALRRRFEGRRLVVVFQPHQASRTRCLMKDFAAALAGADAVWLPPIFFARDSEEERRAVTSEDLAAHVRNEGGDALTLPDLTAVVEHAASHVRPGDVVVTMGAGTIDEVAHGLAQRL